MDGYSKWDNDVFKRAKPNLVETNMDDRFIKVMKGSYEHGRENEKLQQGNTSISESRYDGGGNGKMDYGTSRASRITFGSSFGEVHTSSRENEERNVSRNILNETFKDGKVDIAVDVNYLNCTFVNVDFSNTKLSNVDFKGSSIIGCKFDNTQIENCDFPK